VKIKPRHDSLIINQRRGNLSRFHNEKSIAAISVRIPRLAVRGLWARRAAARVWAAASTVTHPRQVSDVAMDGFALTLSNSENFNRTGITTVQ
jgi:hypothetical protein